MAKLFSFEDTTVETPVNIDEELAGNEVIQRNVDSTMEQIEVGFESIDKLLRMSALMERSGPDNQYATEAYALLLETVNNNLGIGYGKTQLSIESLKTGQEVSFEGIKDTIGIVIKKVIDFVAHLYDMVEIVWNHTVRGLSEIKRKVANIHSTAQSVKGNPRKEAIPMSKIAEALQTTNGSTLTGSAVNELVKNHLEVASSCKGFREALSALVDHDIDRVQGIFNRAKTGEAIKKDDVYGGTVEKMNRLVNLAKKNNSIKLGEGQSIVVEIDNEALDSYAFNRASLQLTMTNNFGLAKPDAMVTASKGEAIEIAKNLEKLAAQMSNMTDLYLHFTHTYSAQIKNQITYVLTGALGALLGPVGLPLSIISIVAWLKSLYYSVINLIKFFGTKFSNVTFRTMTASCAYIESSV